MFLDQYCIYCEGVSRNEACRELPVFHFLEALVLKQLADQGYYLYVFQNSSVLSLANIQGFQCT